MKAIQLTLWYLRTKEGKLEPTGREIADAMDYAARYLDSIANVEDIVAKIIDEHDIPLTKGQYLDYRGIQTFIPYLDYRGIQTFIPGVEETARFNKFFNAAIKDLPVIPRVRIHGSYDYTYSCLFNMSSTKMTKNPKITRRKNKKGLWVYKLKDPIFHYWDNRITNLDNHKTP